ncbi:helix-turn-helix domain-containing protein [Fontibacillus sp. BL9]|uniref:helix-turn-helix domain-containing protein n=1 Tax=Fontibacillus sp. BL9 TaxID=3389971 RepID=UPI00397D0918
MSSTSKLRNRQPGSPGWPMLLFSSIHKRTCPKHVPFSGQNIIIPAYMLCLVTEGSGWVNIEGKIQKICRGACYFLTPGLPLELNLNSEVLQYQLMLIRPLQLQRYGKRWVADSGNSDGLRVVPGMLDLDPERPFFERICQLYEDSRSPGAVREELQLRGQSLIYDALNSPQLNQDAPADSGLEESIGYMLRHFRSKVGLDTLANIAGLTPSSYSRRFKREKGLTPVEYLSQIRITHAKRLLSRPNISVKEAAGESGFGNEFYFSRLFKREVGVSPTIYMKRKELRVAVASCYHYQENLRSLGTGAVYVMNGAKYPDQSEEFSRNWIAQQLSELRSETPDLIIGDHRHRHLQASLKEIAPVVFLEFSLDWRRNHRIIAELVGRENEAEQNCRRLERKSAYARQELTDLIGNDSVSLLRLYNRKIRIQGCVNHPLNDLLYTELGLKPGSCVPLDERNFEYPLHNLPLLESDYLFIYKHKVMMEEDQVFDRVLESSAWQNSQAVRNNRTRVIPNWIGMSWSPVGREAIIDDLLEM